MLMGGAISFGSKPRSPVSQACDGWTVAGEASSDWLMTGKGGTTDDDCANEVRMLANSRRICSSASTSEYTAPIMAWTSLRSGSVADAAAAPAVFIAARLCWRIANKPVSTFDKPPSTRDTRTVSWRSSCSASTMPGGEEAGCAGLVRRCARTMRAAAAAAAKVGDWGLAGRGRHCRHGRQRLCQRLQTSAADTVQHSGSGGIGHGKLSICLRVHAACHWGRLVAVAKRSKSGARCICIFICTFMLLLFFPFIFPIVALRLRRCWPSVVLWRLRGPAAKAEPTSR